MTSDAGLDTLVFVYGTLKTGEPNHHWLTGARGRSSFLGPGLTLDTWPLVVVTKYNIPMLLDHEGVGKKIKGEVYNIDQEMLEYLDVLEAYPHLYTRKKMNVLVNSEIRKCWMYMIPNFREELLEEDLLEEYSSEMLPWNQEYLKEKDGSFLFSLVKKS